MFTSPLALGSLGVESLLRHRSLLGALVFRDCCIVDRSCEPWCSEMFTLPPALGSLGVEHCLRHRSLLGALVLRDCHVTARYWETFFTSFLRYRSLLHVASLGLLGGPFKGLFDNFSPKRRLSVDNCLRRRSLLGALVLRACYVTARS